MKLLLRISFALFILISCTKEQDIKFMNMDKNPFKIVNTSYKYKDHSIFNISIPDPDLYESFIYGNYILVDGNRLYTIGLFKKCEDEYRTSNYKVYEIPKDTFKTDGTFDPCNIYFQPLLRFDLTVGDTDTFYNQKWVTLKNKIVDSVFHDTIYVFHRHWMFERVCGIVASKERAIVGLYSIKRNKAGQPVIEHIIGDTYLGSVFNKYDIDTTGQKYSQMLSNEEIDLSSIKEFKRE